MNLIKAAPRGWAESLRFLGPGLIVIGAIVGSGELIATTLLGAQVGFLLLWLVLISCLIKVVIQEELAYYVITSGGTVLDALNLLPGPRPFGVSWCSWLLLIYVALGVLSAVGIVGMAALVVLLASDSGSVTSWSLLIAVVTCLFSAVARTSVLKACLPSWWLPLHFPKW